MAVETIKYVPSHKTKITTIILTTIATAVVLSLSIFAYAKYQNDACESFWHEHCVITPIPASISVGFNKHLYDDLTATERLDKAATAEPAKASTVP
jgi:hypothetical protein